MNKQRKGIIAVLSFFLTLGVLGAGSPKLVLEEDLRFGGPDMEDSHYDWLDSQSPCFFEIDKKGHIFISDQRNIRLLEFDTEGKFVKELAHQGQGPGEYQYLNQFNILDDGSAIGVDLLQGTIKLHFYTTKLEFDRSEVISGLTGFLPIVEFSPSGKQAYAWALRFNADQTMSSIGMITNSKLEPIRSFRESPWPLMTGETLANRPVLIDSLAMQFSGVWALNEKVAIFLSDGRLLLADNKKKVLEFWDAEMKHMDKRIDIGIKPAPFEQKEREALISSLEDHLFNQGGQALMDIITPQVLRESIEKASIPLVQFPAQDLIPMENGGFMVASRILWDEGKIDYIAFDSQGKRLATGEYPNPGVFTIFGTRLKFKNGYAYAMEKNEEGDNQMVRYKLKWTGRSDI